MNESIHTDNSSQAQEPHPDLHGRGTDASTSLGHEKSRPAGVALLNQATQGAHDTIDRLADRAEPAVRSLSAGVSAVAGSVNTKADRFRETGTEWVEGVRCNVRTNPLMSLAAAFALGAVISRIMR